MEFDYHLRHPFVMTCAGPTQAGKSTLIHQLIRRKDEVILPKIEKVIYCYNEDEPPFAEELRGELGGDVIRFQKGMMVDVDEGNTIPILVILDDFMAEAAESKEVCAMATRGSSHRSMSVIITLQNFFFKNCRTLTLNSKYIVLFRNPMDMSVIRFLSRQMGGGKEHPILAAAYDDATKNKSNSYLFLDMSQQQNDDFRIRSNLFPDPSCIVYVIQKSY